MNKQIPISLKYQIAFLLLLILSCQNFLHIIKDAMPMTLGNGYSMIPILRVLSMIITTILFPIYYLISNKFSITQIFISFFILSILIILSLGFIIFPHNIHQDIIYIQNPFQGIIYYWYISLFYIFCDIWTFIAYGLLFWNMLNTSFNNEQAKEYYNFFLSFGNIGLIISGLVTYFFSYQLKTSSNLMQIQSLCLLIASLFLISIIIIYHTSKQYLSHMRKEHMQHKSKKLKLSIIQSIKYIISNKYIMLMFLISISYASIQQLAEPYYQAEKKYFFSQFNQFVEINSIITIIIGFFSILLNRYGKQIYNKLSWIGTSLIAPISITSMLSLFLIMKIIQNHFEITNNYFQYIIFTIAITQFILIKSIRFSIWDFSFEMLYIPLNSEQQSKGKATIALLSAKYGKALAQSFIILNHSVYITLIVILLLSYIWIKSTFSISKRYNKYITEENKQLNI